MKRILLISLLFLGCQKEDVENCGCGIVTDDGVTSTCPWLQIVNDCSGNTITICVDEKYWLNTQIGDHICPKKQGAW